MKKILFSFLVLTVFSGFCLADCCKTNKCEETKTTCEKETCKPTCSYDKDCDKCIVDDDEYCIYNQCYFDKHYKKMKKALCLTEQQEKCIDNIYKNFKYDMENQHAKYRARKNKLLEMIECDNDCYKEQVKALKELRAETKEKCKDFRDDVKEQLCRNQYSEFRKFQRQEKRKMKKMYKYGKIIKLPCEKCCD